VKRARRPALIVTAVIVAVAVGVLWFPGESLRGTRPDAGACVAPPGAEQRDLDPDDSSEAPWPHVAGERVVVHVAVGGLPARYAALVVQAAGIWSRSPCVELVVGAACPAGSHCSTVVARDRGNYDDTDAESDSDDRAGVRRANTISLYRGLLDRESDNGVLATIVHEMGHTLGLVHRRDPGSVMNEETDDSTDPVPDATDLANLAVLYG